MMNTQSAAANPTITSPVLRRRGSISPVFTSSLELRSPAHEAEIAAPSWLKRGLRIPALPKSYRNVDHASPSTPLPALMSLSTFQTFVSIAATWWLASHDTYAILPSGLTNTS
jgi:hypothetical protein